MATTPYPFVSGTVLTASQLNSTFNIPTTTKTASHTLIAADAGTRVIMNSASATTITVNTSIFAASDVVEIQNIGAGVCTITAGTATVSTTGSLALAQNGSGRLVFTAAGTSIFQANGVTATASAVVQVKSTAKTDTFTTTSATFTDITGLSISITPTSASNKVLIFVTLAINGTSGTNAVQARLMRDSTAIGIGDTAGSRTRTTIGNSEGAATEQQSANVIFLDSPATTSATTYKMQIRSNSAAATSFINRTSNDTDTDQLSRAISTITVMEVTP